MSNSPVKKPVVKTDEEKGDATMEMIARYSAAIGEHCDTVVILATQKDSNGDTGRLTSIEGDDYAAYGVAKAFVTMFEGRMKKGNR